MMKVLALTILLSCFLNQPCHADEDHSAKLKTVYLVNFARYVSWNRNDVTNVNLCIHRNSSIYVRIDKINNVDVGQERKLVVIVDPVEISLCDIVYWDKQTAHLRDASATNKTLEVTDSRNAFDKDMDVLLYLEDNKLRFFIAKDTFNKSNFKISSKLMRLSRPPVDINE